MDGMPMTDPALMNATVNDPACIKGADTCPAFAAAEALSQKEVSFLYQFNYGHYVCWYLFATLGIFVFAHGYSKWSERKPIGSSASSRKGSKPTFFGRLKAIVRYISYRRVPGKLSDRLGMPTAGITILVLLFILYCLILTFACRPYYREHRGYGSPPLATRTGLMATALTPWIVALSGKANLITMITGIGHERLNVMHRWVARICLGLSVAHTAPFLAQPVWDGGYAALHEAFYAPGALEYTGTPPLAILAGLVFFSIPWLRRRFYEAFFYLHYLLAVVYLGVMFWHTSNIHDSWIYLWATIAIWLFSSLLRILWFNRSLNVRQPNWIQGYDAKVTPLSGPMTKIEVFLPKVFTARPGQHCFLRFPTVSLLDNHPFTLAWTSLTDNSTCSTLTFFARSRAGFTARLFASTNEKAQPPTNVWIDGPYGGIDARLERSYDHMLLIAGGIGITSSLPWLQHVMACHIAGGTRLSSVKLIWVVHEASHIAWANEYLRSVSQSDAAAEFLTIEIYCTSLARGTETRPASSSETVDLEKADGVVEEVIAASALRTWEPGPGRPDLKSIIGGLRGGRAVVIGCGPTSLKVDLSNACARTQLQVLKGGLEELTLHTEAFDW